MFFLLISRPAPTTTAQVKAGESIPPTKVKVSNSVLNETAKKNVDTINNLLNAAKEVVGKPPKEVVKYRYRYRTKIKEVHDTLYIALPANENDSLYIVENCPDTVYIDRPVYIKKKSFFKRLF